MHRGAVPLVPLDQVDLPQRVVTVEQRCALLADEGLQGGLVAVDRERCVIDIPVTAGARQSLDLLGSLQAAGAEVEGFQLRRPTLDDVFLSLTGEHVDEPRQASTNGSGCANSTR